MSTPFLGEVKMWAGNFAWKSWALCNGQTMSIQQNSALFSLLGTTYGGNGTQTFQLPNLQSRVPMGQGQGPGLTTRVMGEVGGLESVTLTNATTPQHNHLFVATTATSTATKIATNVVLGQSPSNGGFYASGGTAGQLNPGTLPTMGGNQSHTNIMPFLSITFMIALQGIFPSRN